MEDFQRLITKLYNLHFGGQCVYFSLTFVNCQATQLLQNYCQIFRQLQT